MASVAGKHCESGDIVVDADYLPGDVEPGDLVMVPATGAYCWSLASNYNYLGRPAVVAVADGEARVIVRGETIEDLLARDTGVSTSSTSGLGSTSGVSTGSTSGPGSTSGVSTSSTSEPVSTSSTNDMKETTR